MQRPASEAHALLHAPNWLAVPHFLTVWLACGALQIWTLRLLTHQSNTPVPFPWEFAALGILASNIIELVAMLRLSQYSSELPWHRAAQRGVLGFSSWLFLHFLPQIPGEAWRTALVPWLQLLFLAKDFAMLVYVQAVFSIIEQVHAPSGSRLPFWYKLVKLSFFANALLTLFSRAFGVPYGLHTFFGDEASLGPVLLLIPSELAMAVLLVRTSSSLQKSLR